MMKTFRILSFLLTISTTIIAQDFTFSQFYDVPLYRNPALAGIFNGNLRFTSAYRNQWASVTVPYETKAVSAEVTFPIGYTNDLFTVGLQLANDVAGDSKLGRTQFLPVFTFHKAFADEVSYLTIGAMGGLIQSQFDPSQLHFGGQYQYATNSWSGPAPAIINTSMQYWDASAGLAFNSELFNGARYYYGAAVYHFLRSKVYFFDPTNDILRPRFIINGGINFETGNLDHLYMFGDAMMQGGHRQLIMGLYYSHIIRESYDNSMDNISFSVGTSYRWADAVVPNLRLEMRHWQLGASYDVNISKLKAASTYRGGMEVTLSHINTLNALRSRKSEEHYGCPVRF